jgi:hypothetical protein
VVGRQSGAFRRRSFDTRRKKTFLFFARNGKRTSRDALLFITPRTVAFRSRRGESTANRAESRVEIFRGNRSRPRGARRGVRARPSVAGRRRVPARRARRLVSVCLASAVETRAGRAAGCGDARGGHRLSSGGPFRSPAPTRDGPTRREALRRARGIPSGRRVAEHTHRARHVPPGRGREAET